MKYEIKQFLHNIWLATQGFIIFSILGIIIALIIGFILDRAFPNLNTNTEYENDSGSCMPYGDCY